MKSKQEVSYGKKGFIKKIKLEVYPEELTLKQSKSGGLYLLDAIRDAMIEDTERFYKEEKMKNKSIKAN
jgi:hypothetical protein